MIRKSLFAVLASLTMLGLTPVLAQGIDHRWFMRESIVGVDADGFVFCTGKSDSAKIAQVLEVYRTGYRHPTLVGHAVIDKLMGYHFAHAHIIDGVAKEHNFVELSK